MEVERSTNWDHVPSELIRKVLRGEVVDARDYETAIYLSEQHADSDEKGAVWEEAETAVYAGEYPRVVEAMRRFWRK